MRESTFNAKVNKRVKAGGVYALKVNINYVAGVPDNWYSGPGTDHWSEFKWFSVLPVVSIHLRSGVTPKLSNLQNAWLNARHDEGRDVSVIVGSAKRCIVLLDREWEHPFNVEDMTLSHNDIADWIVEGTQ